MKRRPSRDPWFCVPVLLAMAMDAGVTLAMQPAAYWGDHSRLQEGNPTWELLLQRGPFLFIAGFALYGAGVAALLLWLRGGLQKLLGMFVLLAHTFGAASWALLRPDDASYWWVLMGVLLLEAAAFAVYWHVSAVCDRIPEGH